MSVGYLLEIWEIIAAPGREQAVRDAILSVLERNPILCEFQPLGFVVSLLLYGGELPEQHAERLRQAVWAAYEGTCPFSARYYPMDGAEEYHFPEVAPRRQREDETGPSPLR